MGYSLRYHRGVTISSYGADHDDEFELIRRPYRRNLKAFVKERLTLYKYPRWIEFLPEMPMTATGKIQRFALRGKTTA